MSTQPPPLPSSPAGASPATPAGVKDKPRRRGAIDTLVARDQTAVFWFLMACFVAGLCAWYLVIMSEALKARPPFVVMDTSGAYYVTPGLNYDSKAPTGSSESLKRRLDNPMHAHLTSLAIETMFERGPLGLVHENRVGRLFTRNGVNDLRTILKKEDAYFVSQKVEQTVEMTSEPVIGNPRPTAVPTMAKGQITRRSVFKGEPKVETYRFTVIFFWKLNPAMRENKAFPSVVEKIEKYELEKISDS